MIARDQYKFDSAIVGLNGLYYTIGKNSCGLQTPGIVAEDQIITIGIDYLLFGSHVGLKIELSIVKLLSICYDNGSVNLLIQDIISPKKYTITTCLDCIEKPCHWMLVDPNYLIKRMKGEKHGSK